MIRVEVTAEDIAKGKRNSTERCAVALACTRAGLRDVEVDCGRLRFRNDSDEDGWAAVSLPLVAIEFYDDFDRGRPVQPITFSLDVTP